jgi:hypothetical protein|tara:strand:- start:99 stop:1274 length:1176 start_codon:yes stop_codon:yes gene_type:complete
MFSGKELNVFEKYREAGAHAFSTGVVSDNDKDIYWNIHSSLCQAAEDAITTQKFDQWFEKWSTRFHRDSGVQGHRPVDLWASVLNRESDVFGRYPQVYVIASGLGLEIGFSVAIHEDDYYNANVKRRNRAIIPVLYRKLPDPESELVQRMNERLSREGVWQFGQKSRKRSYDDFKSISDLFRFLKSPQSSPKGGGSIYRAVTPEQIDSDEFDLNALFAETISFFAPLMRELTPSSRESSHLEAQHFVDEVASEIPDFDPDSVDDGRKKVLRSVATRQGQAAFRDKLLDAYGSSCAITGTAVPSTLQAAHIVPYSGVTTNSQQNGLLLRADIHNLFDLGLIQINSENYEVQVSPELSGTEYYSLQGKKIALPGSRSKCPSKKALAEHRHIFS